MDQNTHTNQYHNLEHTKNWYDKSYKLILIVPIVLFIASIIYLFSFTNIHGDIVRKDVSITGGTTISVFEAADIQEISAKLKPQFPDLEIRTISDFRTGAQRGFFVETTSSVDEIKPALEQVLGYSLDDQNSSIEFTGATLSTAFYQQLRLAVVISFILMALVVFLIFRTPIPSLAVISAALADMVMTIVVIDLTGMSLSTAGFVALLMLIGYSVDTDILLTTRVLKQSGGTINQHIYGAFKTGITMTIAAIVAVAVAFIFTRSLSATLSQIFTILLIGLVLDIFNTWITNASLLKWYTEAKKK